MNHLPVLPVILPMFVGALFFALNVVAAPASRYAAWLQDRLGERVLFWILPLSLSYDHRVIDGSLSAQFVQKIRSNLEKYDTENAI